jgi:hypothetical protein
MKKSKVMISVFCIILILTMPFVVAQSQVASSTTDP